MKYWIKNFVRELGQTSRWRVYRRRVAVAAALVVGTLVITVPTSDPGTRSGVHPISSKQRCESCHTPFGEVLDTSCLTCHSGIGPHPGKTIDVGQMISKPICAACHIEHRGPEALIQVVNGVCTACHANVGQHATGATVANVSAFRIDKHPEFRVVNRPDGRPIKFGHFQHTPVQAKMVRGFRFPMRCEDCHRMTIDNGMMPVTFEEHCASCHARELEYDVFGLLGAGAPPAPHWKDPTKISQYIRDRYRQALQQNPSLTSEPLKFGGQPLNAEAWLEAVATAAEKYLFGQKCGYCHEMRGFSAVAAVNQIRGHFNPAKPTGEPWLERGEFNHLTLAHRKVACADCHRKSRASLSASGETGSKKTSDVLIPGIDSCLPCHGRSSAGRDRCPLCHKFHNLEREQMRRRRTDELAAP